jgi:hypothetical protein
MQLESHVLQLTTASTSWYVFMRNTGVSAVSRFARRGAARTSDCVARCDTIRSGKSGRADAAAHLVKRLRHGAARVGQLFAGR